MKQSQQKQASQCVNVSQEPCIQDWVIEIDNAIVKEECAQGLHSVEFCSLYLPSQSRLSEN